MNPPLPWCVCCGSRKFTYQDVLWPELIAAWELQPHEAAYLNRQQGLRCAYCQASLRSQTLAAALLSRAGFRGIFAEFVRTPVAQSWRVLEINPAGELTPFLSELPGHVLTRYPQVDMRQLPYDDGTFDVVVHSDTLEHVPQPLQGLSECRRVLNEQGCCAFTVPVVVGRLTRDCTNRAPSYHGSREHPQDCRVYTEFGADAWAWPLQAGFSSCRLFTLDYPASVAFIAEKSSPASPPTSPELSPAVLVSGRPPTRSHRHVAALAAHLASGHDVLHIGPIIPGGIDWLAERARSVAILHADNPDRPGDAVSQRPNVRCLAGSSLPCPMADASVDLVAALDALALPATPEAWIAEIRRVLRTDGVALLALPMDGTGNVASATIQAWRERFRESFRQCLSLGQRSVQGSIAAPLEPDVRSSGWVGFLGHDRLLETEVRLTSAHTQILLATNREAAVELPVSLFESVEDRVGPPPQYAELQARFNAVIHSRSWRITAPLRALSNWWRGRPG